MAVMVSATATTGLVETGRSSSLIDRSIRPSTNPVSRVRCSAQTWYAQTVRAQAVLCELAPSEQPLPTRRDS